MKITLEQIDVVRKRTNASYKEAKEALERFDGDIVEALAYLDSEGKASTSKDSTKKGITDTIRELIHKGNITKFLVTKDEKTILNVPLNVMIILALVGNYIFAAALLIALVMGYKFAIVPHGEPKGVPVIYKNTEVQPDNHQSV